MRVNPNFAPNILNDLWQSQAQEQTALEEISTSKRVNRPSDDPTAAAADVLNQAAQSRTDQYLKNTSDLESMLQTADSTLSSVVTSLNQAISLGVQGANSELTPSNLQAIAQQVQAIQNQMVQLANTSFQGSFLFGGTLSQSAPYVLDPSQADGVQYDGNSGVNSVAIADGRTMQVNLPGDQIFQGSSGNVMGSLQQLMTSLQNNDINGISAATTQLKGALDYVSQQRVFYGNAINQLDSNQSFLQQEKVNLQTDETSLVGADMSEAATDLSQAQTTHQAALAALARVIPQSLLDYLK